MATAPRAQTPVVNVSLSCLLSPPEIIMSTLPYMSWYMAGKDEAIPDEQAESTVKLGPCKLSLFAIIPAMTLVIQPGRVCSVTGGNSALISSFATPQHSSRTDASTSPAEAHAKSASMYSSVIMGGQIVGKLSSCMQPTLTPIFLGSARVKPADVRSLSARSRPKSWVGDI